MNEADIVEVEGDLTEAGLNEAAGEWALWGKCRWLAGNRYWGKCAESAAATICMQMTSTLAYCARRQHWSMTARGAARRCRHIDHRGGSRGAVAGRIASRVKADLDYGWRQRDHHDVS
jgi:hypothetical protein